MNIRNWILDHNGEPLEEPDVVKWGRWFESNNRTLALDTRKGVQVSTVFLGIDHNFNEGEPILWETMIFGGTHDQYQARYATREEALAGHKRALAMVERANETIESFQREGNSRVHGRQ